MSIHKDHRARMKARFAKDGLDAFDEHQVLELLLFYCIPRRDTNEIAHNLINRFGSLSAVLDAPQKELEKVEGMGRNSALFLCLLKDLQRYYAIQKSKKEEILKDIEQCGRYLTAHFQGKKNECVYLLCLDAKCKVISCCELEEGNVNAASISIRKIVDMALTKKATSVVLAHNHPSGIALPSAEDIATTKRVAQALQLVDVVLIDHIVVADDDFVSMVHSGLYMPEMPLGRRLL